MSIVHTIDRLARSRVFVVFLEMQAFHVWITGHRWARYGAALWAVGNHTTRMVSVRIWVENKIGTISTYKWSETYRDGSRAS